MARLIIAGDFCPYDRVSSLIEKNTYYAVFDDIKGIISHADYSIVNFECPIVDEDSKPIIKEGPSLHCSKTAVDAIKYAGFDAVTLANNHFLDYGESGAKTTLDYFKQRNVDYVGAGFNLKDAERVLIKQFDDITVSFINCCEHEFSIATSEKSGSNPLNPIVQHYKIKEAKEHSDFVIVIIHGGPEHYQLPTPRMKETYRFFINSGADIVINHHQHCLSGYEIYKDKPIFYGLGNFCFDNPQKRNSNWNTGILVSLNLEKKQQVQFDIIPFEQCNMNCKITPQINQDALALLDELNVIINDDKKLETEYTKFIDDKSWDYLFPLEPYTGRIGGLRYRKILPSLISKKFMLRLYGLLICESHIDRLKLTLNRILFEQ